MTQPAAPEWTPEFVVDEARARALIAAQFPELAAASIEPFANGWDNTAFLVGGTYVFRFPRRTIAGPLIESEIAILPLIAPKLSAPIPVPVYAGRAAGDYPWRFAGYARLAGRPISDLAARERDPGNVQVARALGRFARELHALDPAPALAAGLRPDEHGRLDGATRIPLALDRLRSVHEAGLIDDPAPLLACIEALPEDGTPARRIVHGDLYARHVLADERGALSGVIDWGDVHHGEPALDLAIADLLFDRAAQREFFAAYGEVDERTRARARWRAIYHAAMTSSYALRIGGDAALLESSVDALVRLRAAVAG